MSAVEAVDYGLIDKVLDKRGDTPPGSSAEK